MRILKPLVFVAACVPLARLVALAATDALGANPIEALTRATGFWTLVFLCLVLAVTPLRRLSGWNALAGLRRMLGLFCFFHAMVHFATYVWFDQWFDLGAIIRDVIKRPFITAGFVALLLLVPLALTSTHAMMRRLGRRWLTLHRLVYAVAVLAILHFWWHKAGKNDLAEPALFALVIAALLGYRLVGWIRRRAAVATPPASGLKRPL
jgi:methionine sulfoxide reductase heme-binding subunit